MGRKQETNRSDLLRTSKQGRTLLSQSTEQDETWGVQGVLWVPGSREIDAGRVWKSTNNNSQWVRREAAGQRQGSLAAGSGSGSGSGSIQTRVRKFVAARSQERGQSLMAGGSGVVGSAFRSQWPPPSSS